MTARLPEARCTRRPLLIAALDRASARSDGNFAVAEADEKRDADRKIAVIVNAGCNMIMLIAPSVSHSDFWACLAAVAVPASIWACFGMRNNRDGGMVPKESA